MHQTFKVLIECLSPLIALFSGTLAFRKTSVFLKVLFVQLCVWVLTYALSYAITNWQQQHDLPINNHFLFNIHLLVESALLALAAWHFLNSKNYRRLILFLYMLVFITWCIEYFSASNSYYSNADFIGCCSTSIIYALVIYVCINSPEPWWRHPELYASTGIFLYFIGSIPHISAFEALQENYPQLHSFIFYLINDVLSNLRYLLLAISFWLLNFRSHE